MSRRSVSRFVPVIITIAFVAGLAFLLTRTGGLERAKPRFLKREILDGIVLSPEELSLPGKRPCTTLRYEHPSAARVLIAGSWDHWSARHPLVKVDGEWHFDTRDLQLDFGRYQFKFLPDGKWEKGDNRELFVGLSGMLELPSDAIVSAVLEELNRIDIVLRDFAGDVGRLDVRIRPKVKLRDVIWREASGQSRQSGYSVTGDRVTFLMDEAVYGVSVPASAKVAVAGSFNGWKADASSQWQLRDEDDDGTWEGTFALSLLGSDVAGEYPEFKFMIDGDRWLPPPQGCPNAVSDGKGNTNLRLDPGASRGGVLEVYTVDPLSLSVLHSVLIDGLGKRVAWRAITPGRVLDTFASDQPLGPWVDTSRNRTDFRIFAPRASRAELCLFDTPFYDVVATRQAAEPSAVYSMQWSSDGTWDVSVPGIGFGQYYGYRIDGPNGPGEGFAPQEFVGDPYARAVAHGDNAAIVVDFMATNRWFGGWSDHGFRAPAWQDAIIYETHVRDFSIDESAGVDIDLRGKFAGMLATAGKGTGLDHLRALGVNTIELMPVAEFGNGSNRYDWGYGTAYYFAPEASYGIAPLEGSQYHEFKHLVNELHRGGFSVILDVVYNHVGSPNVFHSFDRKYYFRLTPDLDHSNFSGCGNDVRTEAPMMRRLIVDNVLYWMNEFHVDGFRFDLAELIDMETLMAVRDAAREVNPNVLLISEPWSFRGDHKRQLKGTGWAAWNDEYRDAVKNFVRGYGDRQAVQIAIRGSVGSWTADPLQSINYVESHDDMCLTDELSPGDAHDGRNLSRATVARSRLAATALFTSLGIPMLCEGQEFLRSKQGIRNTFDRGDAVNGIRWTDRDRPRAAETLDYYRGLIKLRQSLEGEPFRVPLGKWTPPGYYAWILPLNPNAIGYIVNGQRKHSRFTFIVFLNADEQAVEFDVPFTKGTWITVGNGSQVDLAGFGEAWRADDLYVRRSVRVAALSSQILMRLPE